MYQKKNNFKDHWYKRCLCWFPSLIFHFETMQSHFFVLKNCWRFIASTLSFKIKFCFPIFLYMFYLSSALILKPFRTRLIPVYFLLHNVLFFQMWWCSSFTMARRCSQGSLIFFLEKLRVPSWAVVLYIDAVDYSLKCCSQSQLHVSCRN